MSVSETDAPALVRLDLFVEGPDGVHLLASECDRCPTLAFPTQPICPECQQPRTGVRELSSGGTVYSFTIVRSRPPNYHGPVPYGLALIELAEGLLVSSMLLSGELDSLAVGLPVVGTTVDVGDGVLSYAFRPTRES